MMNKYLTQAAICAGLLAVPWLPSRLAAAEPQALITAALSQSGRPESDTARDGARHPAETLLFSGVKSDSKVADYAAGSGYYTRLFSAVVGPQGHVYASVPAALFKYANIVKGIGDIQSYATSHANVSVNFGTALDAARYPEKLDVFFISQNYHDLHDKFMGPVDLPAFNRTVYAALKPGGVYVVLDHAAAEHSPPEVTDTLHRIEAATVRREVEAVGFVFDGQNQALANPDDTHALGVFDQSIQGHTDQFILKFRKPMS
jgi:predicted methyltransferase